MAETVEGRPSNRVGAALQGAMHPTLAAFLAGFFVAALVLTHDATTGEELLIRGLQLGGKTPLPSASSNDANLTEATTEVTTAAPATGPPPLGAAGEGNAVIGDAGEAATDSTQREETRGDGADETVSLIGFYDDEDNDPQPATAKHKGWQHELSTRQAFAAAMASTKLSLALWARAAKPLTDSVSFYARAGSQEFGSLAYHFLTTTDPRILAAVVAGAVALVGAYVLAVAAARHLKRARYFGRATAAMGRVRARVVKLWRRVTGPFVRAVQRVRGRGLHSFTSQLNLSCFGHTSLCPPV